MKGIKTTWDLTLLYANENDPQIEKDLKTAETAFLGFAKKYQNSQEYLANEALLARALEDYEGLYQVGIEKPYAYFKYRWDLNSQDRVAQQEVTRHEERYRNNLNAILFFQVALASLPKDRQQEFLKSKILEPFRYFLQCAFAQAKHTLSEPEEKIMNLMGLPSYSLWVKGNEKLVNLQKIPWKKKELSIFEAHTIIASLPKRDRDSLGTKINAARRHVSYFAESELNAVVLNKKIEDGLRHYEKPYSSTVLMYQNEDATVEHLVATVSKNFSIAHRFYKLKAKLLGLQKLSYWDRNAEIGKTKRKIPFEKGVAITRDAFSKFGPEFTEAFDHFLSNGQVDVFPKSHKHGGAYCSSYPSLPTFVLLNYVPDFNSVSTLAHEMGHAFHAKFSKERQRPLYQDHTIATAEVASTLFENFVFDEVFSSLSAEEKIVALHDRIMGSINTIFRQIACFNFELELHYTIREKGELSKEEIVALMNRHMKSYLGPAFSLQEDDGYQFVDWSHLRNFFYVYSYAFGELVSNALYEMYINDHAAKEKIVQFLSAGGSNSPENIFAAAGINVRDPKFFEMGIQKINSDIDLLEQLLKKAK